MSANRDVRTAREKLAELQGLKGEARSLGLPQLTATGGYQRMHRRPKMFINGQVFSIGSENAYTATAQVSQLLWDGGRVFKAVRAARTEQAKGQEDIRDVEAQVRLSVRQTFYQILYTGKMIDVLKRQLDQLKKHLAAIKTRFDKGLESDFTLMRQEVEVSNMEPQLIDAERAMELLYSGLKILTAILPEEEIELKGEFSFLPRPRPEAEALVEKARADRPDLLAQKLREKSLVANVGAEKSGWWPSLTFNTAFEWQGQTNNWGLSSDERADALTSSVNLSWPIFDGLKTNSRVKQAKAQLLQQRYQTEQMEDSVVREVKDALTTLEKAVAVLKSQQGSYETAKRASSIAGERFESGLMNQLELNDTITAQAHSEELYYGAIYDCLSAEAALEKAIGGAM